MLKARESRQSLGARAARSKSFGTVAKVASSEKFLVEAAAFRRVKTCSKSTLLGQLDGFQLLTLQQVVPKAAGHSVRGCILPAA